MATYRMPAEWAAHSRTWLSFPPAGGYVQASGADAVQAWAAVANAIVDFEPVSVLATAESVAQALDMLDPRISVMQADLDDAWLRDNGPTFVVGDDGTLGAVHWRFNAWGQIGNDAYLADAAVGAFVADLAGAKVMASPMVNEGGGICVDGEGTVIVTETVQLHQNRNPGWTKADVEAELARTIGATTCIWLTRGLMGDMQEFRPEVGTNGHVDVLAAFVRPGVVVVHQQSDPDHYDHAVMGENLERLRAARDAHGRRLEIIPIEAPVPCIEDGVAIDHSYINFSFVNNGIVMCSYGDQASDDQARRTLQELFPDRRIVDVDARPIFRNGGGVHCITQQQPAVA
ncbi:MAG: agmatine deiminase family protein [Actinomycetes bacterium]